MAARITTLTTGARVLALGIVAMGLIGFGWRDFDMGQPVPNAFPARPTLAFAGDALMVASGIALARRRTAIWGAVALGGYYALVVAILMNGRVILTHPAEFGAYSSAAEPVAIAAAALIIYAADAKLDSRLASRLIRLGQLAFGGCALLFGVAHFVFMNLTAPLVPKWLPPSQMFWGYATGVAQLAAGVALLTGIWTRLASILLVVMYAAFTLLVHAPMLISKPPSHFIWSENALNIALIGVAWIVAASIPATGPGRCRPPRDLSARASVEP